MKTCVFIFTFLTVLFSCTPNNVQHADQLKKYFEEKNVEGCFALYNNASNGFTVYNLKRYRDSVFSPAATFDIINMLVGLQEGVVEDETKTGEMFQNSNHHYFQKITQLIGKSKLQFWMDSINYGSKKINTTVDSFWLDNSLKITPDEQMGLLKKLYFKQLPFHQRNQEIVKQAMLFENNTKYKLSYKIGVGKKENGNALGWVIGWVEENRHPYFFTINLETPINSLDLNAISLTILKQILKEQGFLEGKM